MVNRSEVRAKRLSLTPSLALALALALASCVDSGPSIAFTESTLNYSDAPAGSITVRSVNYPITRRTGRDRETGEVFVVEYRTRVNGRTVTCVGDIAGCPAAIERQLEAGEDEESSGSY